MPPRGEEVRGLQSDGPKPGFARADAELRPQLPGEARDRTVKVLQQHHIQTIGKGEKRTARVPPVVEVRRAGPAAPQSPAPPPAPPPPPTTGPHPPPGLTLLGHVVNDGEQPLNGLQVRALRKTLLDERPVGRGVSAADGFYRIPCEDQSPPSPTVVCVYDGEREVARSRLICETHGEVVVNLTVVDQKFRMPTEVDRVTSLVTSFVANAPIVSLTDQDLDVLSCASRVRRPLLVALRAAAQIVHASDVPVSAVYGMVRLGLPSTRYGLLAEPERVRAAALAGAMARHIIPTIGTDEVNRILELMRKLSVDEALAPPTDGEPSISPLLASGLPEPALQRAVLAAYVAHQGTPEEFWTKTLAKVPGLGDVQTRERLRLVVGLAAITLGHAPLATELLATKRAPPIKILRDVAGIRQEDWAALIAQSGVPDGIPGDTPAERQATYAKNVAQVVAEAFPTAVVAARLGRQDRGAAQTVGRFLDTHPDFDLATTSVARYLTAHPDGNAALGSNGRQLLEQTQRLFKVTRNATEITALQDAGFGSALAMTRMPATEFAAKMTGSVGGAARALELHAAATRRMETALYLMVTYRDSMARTGTPATPPLPTSPVPTPG